MSVLGCRKSATVSHVDLKESVSMSGHHAAASVLMASQNLTVQKVNLFSLLFYFLVIYECVLSHFLIKASAVF